MEGEKVVRSPTPTEAEGSLRAALGFMAAGMWTVVLEHIAGPYAAPLSIFSMFIYIIGWLFLFADSTDAAAARVPWTTLRISARLLLGVSGLVAWTVGAAAMAPATLGYASVLLWLGTPFLLAYLPFMYAPITIVHAWLFQSWSAEEPGGATRTVTWIGSIWLVAAGAAGISASAFLIGGGIPTGLGLAGWERPLSMVALLTLPPVLAALGYTALTAAWARRTPPIKGVSTATADPGHFGA